MRVLVTGGTGLVGKSAVDHLLRRGHTVRLLSRHADQDSRQWSEGVEPRTADMSDAGSLRGAADGCGAVLHVAGIVDESPPELTFQAVNVDGTRRLVEEARRAGVRRFVYVSSLGADHGESGYHRSKKAAEEVVRAEFPGDWLICRPGNVYGPGDEVVSLLLKIVRTLPVVPTVGAGDQEFQPVWANDLGEALAMAVERTDLSRRALDLAGVERTSTNDLLERFSRLTGKEPARLPVPEWLAQFGARAVDAVGMKLPVNADQITMLQEGNVIPPGGSNALTEVFGVTPTTLDEGLAQLVDALPEKLPSEGTGRLHRERFWADIRGSRLSPEEVVSLVRDDFGSLVPEGLLQVGAEPGTATRLEKGATLTLAVPLRGTVQVRVMESEPRAITNVTVQGHFFAGVIRFLADEPEPGVVRFEVRAYTRSASLLDRLAVRTVGKVAQSMTWGAVVEEVVRRSGGAAPDGVQSEDEVVSAEEAEGVERWSEELVMERKREESPDVGSG